MHTASCLASQSIKVERRDIVGAKNSWISGAGRAGKYWNPRKAHSLKCGDNFEPAMDGALDALFGTKFVEFSLESRSQSR